MKQSRKAGLITSKREIPFFIPKDDCVHEINGVEIKKYNQEEMFRGIFYLCKTFADIVPEVSISEKRNGAWQKIYPSLNAGTGGRGRNYFR